ncbi:hypothetical protein V6667_04915 [Neisseria leonii]
MISTFVYGFKNLNYLYKPFLAKIKQINHMTTSRTTLITNKSLADDMIKDQLPIPDSICPNQFNSTAATHHLLQHKNVNHIVKKTLDIAKKKK